MHIDTPLCSPHGDESLVRLSPFHIIEINPYKDDNCDHENHRDNQWYVTTDEYLHNFVKYLDEDYWTYIEKSIFDISI